MCLLSVINEQQSKRRLSTDVDICCTVEFVLYCKFTCYSEFGNTHLQTVSLAGVEDAYSQHNDADPKGIKAHFRVDESGLLHLDKVY